MDFIRITKKLSPTEAFLIIISLLTVSEYWAIGIPLRKPLEFYSERIIQGFYLYLFSCIISLLLFRAEQIQQAIKDKKSLSWKTSFKYWREDHLSLSRIMKDLRFVNEITLTFVFFIQLKHITPFIRANHYDHFLQAWEAHFVSRKEFGAFVDRQLGPQGAEVLSDAYLFFYPFMAIVCIYFLTQRNIARREAFAFSFAYLWFAGVLLIYLLPTWGPCFFVPESVSNLPWTKVTSMQKDLWEHYQYVMANPNSPEGVFLISGFPSLHLAIPVFCSLFFRRENLFFFVLSITTSGVTLVATIYFGWHYWSDHLGALLLAYSGYRISCSSLVSGLLPLRPDTGEESKMVLPRHSE